MKPRLTRSAIARIAENRIREAIEAGELDDLPGLGKPIPGIDEPYDPLWWVKGWMKRIEEEHGRLARPR
jgi:DnaJ-like protein